MPNLLHQLISCSAMRAPQTEALRYQKQSLDYADLEQQVQIFSQAILSLKLGRHERLAIYLEKRLETVVSIFGTSAAGSVFVPVNPLLKPEQVAYILTDCNVKILVTSADRLHLLAAVLPQCPDLHTVIVIGSAEHIPALPNLNVVLWSDAMATTTRFERHRVIDSDMVAILYTSGSTGKPKGVVLSHRNLVAGAQSVAEYLENTAEDRILAVLPLSFDYGLSQLTTAFQVGACVVLMNYLLPRDIVDAVKDERITGLAAVPPLWGQLALQNWRETSSLRYLTNSGGAMQKGTLDILRTSLPAAKIYLMYGLTEAFRSTFLPPSEIDRRPDSIGRAIPNAQVSVVRTDGTLCAANEAGELVHRGALVALGYWNDAQKTAERFRPAPGQLSGLPIPEIAVWSGDTVRADDEGFFYFVGRSDDMIKVSGYRVSPTEVEEVIHATGLISEVAAVGVPHPLLGQAIVAIIVAKKDVHLTPQTLLKECRRQLPAYMVPAHIQILSQNLPRNPNGKIDRKSLQMSLLDLFKDAP